MWWDGFAGDSEVVIGGVVGGVVVVEVSRLRPFLYLGSVVFSGLVGWC